MGRNLQSYKFYCEATFTKGGLFSADTASSYLYYSDSESVTTNTVSTVMKFKNGKELQNSTIPRAYVEGYYGQKTVNVYHMYVFTGSAREEHQVIASL